jgi:uncharacterized protein
MVRTLQLTTIGAFLERLNGQCVMTTAHAALGGRCFALWNGHGAPVFVTLEKAHNPHCSVNHRPQEAAGKMAARFTNAAAYTDSVASCKGKRDLPDSHPSMEGSINMILPVTLVGAGLAALLNIWLAVRCGQTRTKENVMVGDGGNEALIRRMRAHANFNEFTPIVLILMGLIEYAQGTSTWLWVVMAIYMVGRILHALGMDGFMKGRMIGTLTTMLTTAGLGLYAIAIPHLAPMQVQDVPVETQASN